MLRRHRSAVPALVVAGGYLAVVAVAAVVAAATGDLAPLWRLTIAQEAGEGVAVTARDVAVPALTGLVWTWTLWQALRGPLAAPSPASGQEGEAGQQVGQEQQVGRARVALYAAAATWLLYMVLPSWPWWAAVIEAVTMWAVVLLLHPVLGDGLERPGVARTAGVLGFGGAVVDEVLDLLDLPVPDESALIVGVAALVWTVLVLRAQRGDDRWRPATVAYGIAALVLPLLGLLVPAVLALTGTAIASDSALVGGLAAAAGAVQVIWLTRSGHDLASPGLAVPARRTAAPTG
ncbi:hypothetical protein [Nonomuraea sp. NPDC050783]|uniref:hypothetical protein n=1 Tax=Nonomuraea sp. NPDC050783 TaxID=3154634 RepID=UPI003465D7C6